MRIGFYTPAWPGHEKPNGIVSATRQFAIGLEACGHDVSILTPNVTGPDDRVEQVELNERYSLLDRVRIRLGSPQPIIRRHARAIANAANKLVRDRSLDILIMEESFGWVEHVQQAVDIPVCVFLHGPYFILKDVSSQSDSMAINRMREANEGAGVRAAAGVIAPSRSVLNRTLGHYHADVKQRHVAPNPMSIDATVDQGVFEAPTLPILFVGRFDSIKGGDVLLRAFARLIEAGVDAHLTFAGPDRGAPWDQARIVNISEALGSLPKNVVDKIDYLGAQPKSEVSALRQRHAVAIVCSRFETFPLVGLEAMASGAAVVASNVGGIPEIIDHERTGLLVPPEDPAALAGALERLSEDRELCRRLGAAAQDEIRRRFQPEVIAADLIAFLEAVKQDYNSAA